jgi:hypothetical protein
VTRRAGKTTPNGRTFCKRPAKFAVTPHGHDAHATTRLRGYVAQLIYLDSRSVIIKIPALRPFNAGILFFYIRGPNSPSLFFYLILGIGDAKYNVAAG